MTRFLTIILLIGTSAVAGNLRASVYDATDAMSEAPYHLGDHHHALWFRNLGSAPSNSWLFDPSPASFLVNGMGNIEFTGSVANKDDSSLTGSFDFRFSPAIGGVPKQELTPGSYVGGPMGTNDIDPASWSFWDLISGSFSGTGDLTGLELTLTQRPMPSETPENDVKGQLGVGANGKNGRYGYSSWFFWAVSQCEITDAASGATLNDGCSPLGLTTASSDVGDININLSPVPLPAAFWLFGAAILGLAGLRRRA